MRVSTTTMRDEFLESTVGKRVWSERTDVRKVVESDVMYKGTGRDWGCDTRPGTEGEV